MIFDQVSFNVNWVVTLSKDQFLRHITNQELWPGLSEKDRRLKLGQVYDLIQTKRKASENHQFVAPSQPKN